MGIPILLRLLLSGVGIYLIDAATMVAYTITHAKPLL